MKRKTLRIFILILAVMILMACGGLLYFYLRTMHYSNDAQRREDLARADAEAPDCLVLSMVQPEYYPAEDFAYYRGVSTVGAAHTFANLYDIKYFLETTTASPSSVYLVLDPDKIASLYGYHASLYGKAYRDTLMEIAQSDTSVTYELLLTVPSLDYWESLSDAELEEYLASYRNLVNVFATEPNVRMYFPGAEEWLIANPGNYESARVWNESVSQTILAFTFRDDALVLTTENMEERLKAIRTLAGGTTTEPLLANDTFEIATDLSDIDIVFFGDSVIGNFNDSTSIPGVVAGFTGAHTYNLGLGGSSAVSSADSDFPNLVTMVELFLAGDSSALTDYPQVSEELGNYSTDHSGAAERTTYFVINYGLNDYFGGSLIDTPQTDDPASCYTGGLRTAISLLRENYPDCRILLMTPNFCSYYSNGTNPQSDAGGTLEDYADAVMQVGEELGVEVIDNYHLGINAKNHDTYLNDGCHPNELGRYIIGRHIVSAL